MVKLRTNQYDGAAEYWVMIRERGSRKEKQSHEEVRTTREVPQQASYQRGFFNLVDIRQSIAINLTLTLSISQLPPIACGKGGVAMPANALDNLKKFEERKAAEGSVTANQKPDGKKVGGLRTKLSMTCTACK